MPSRGNQYHIIGIAEGTHECPSKVASNTTITKTLQKSIQIDTEEGWGYYGPLSDPIFHSEEWAFNIIPFHTAFLFSIYIEKKS